VNATPSKVKIGLIGYGYWGPNLARNFREVVDCELVSICDLRADRLDQVARIYPGVRRESDWSKVVADPGTDAIIIATPVSSHFEFAREALRCGKHVLVEKPLAPSSREAEELVLMAESRQRVVMVGHTFVYSGAVRRIRQLTRDGALGELLYFDSTRANLGVLQDDINVIWDLAPHDLSILDLLLESQPAFVSATGASHTNRRLEDVAFITLHYPSAFIAHVSVNWLSPVKVRTILLGGSDRMVVYDDTESIEKLRVYNRGVERNGSSDKRHNELIRSEAGEAIVPKLDATETLQIEARDFVDSILAARSPLADGRSGLRVVRLIEAACLSMSREGRPVELSSLAG